MGRSERAQVTVAALLAAAFALAAVVSTVTAVLAWRRRHGTPAAVALAIALAGCAAWSLADLGQTVLPATGQMWSVRLSFPAVYTVVLGLYGATRTVVDPHFRPSRVLVGLIAVPPIVLLPIILFAPVPGPFLESFALSGVPAYPHVAFGPVYWVHTAYCYVVLAGAFTRLVLARRRAARVFRAQLDSLLLASFVPVVGNLLVIGAPALVGHRDVVPLFFTVTALMNAWAILRQGFLRIIPVARARVLESVNDSVLVIDAYGRIVDANPAARHLARRLRPDLRDDIVGLAAVDIGNAITEFVTEDRRRTVELLPGYHADMRTTVLSDSRGRLLGTVLVCHDISDLVSARTQLENQLDLVERLQRELLEQTVRDPLTGVHNRRYLTESLRAALAEADRSGKPVTLMVVDVDHFKAVNDEHGHLVGDRVLTAVAQSLAGAVRAGDTVARFGGEEFVVVLPGAGRADAVLRADQLRLACNNACAPAPTLGDAARRLPSSVIPSVIPSVTVSIGVAVYGAGGADADGHDADALIGAADGALYVAKSTGRNRVAAAATRSDRPHLVSRPDGPRVLALP